MCLKNREKLPHHFQIGIVHFVRSALTIYRLINNRWTALKVKLYEKAVVKNVIKLIFIVYSLSF